MPTPMPSSDDEGDVGINYKVVMNHEEQYSIWPSFRPCPAGWREVGVAGSKSQCLDHIEKVWTDMRPLSLRMAMANAAGSGEGR